MAAVDLTLENRVEIKRLCNLLRRAGGFTLAFASVAHQGLRKRLVIEQDNSNIRHFLARFRRRTAQKGAFRQGRATEQEGQRKQSD